MSESESSGFRTTLANFAGPLDLLLYLIKKNEIDILDIPIADVLAQYEEYVRLLRDIDVNLAADYLVMATTLMEIKARMLLPQARLEEDDEEIEDPRENLVRQLLEYREYKERALRLAERLRENQKLYRRPVDRREIVELNTIELGKVSVWDLVTAFLRVQKSIAADRPGDVVYTERPLSFYMELIQDAFTRNDSDTVRFEELFRGSGPVDRYVLVGVFLSILELVRLGALGVVPGEEPDEILVRKRMPDLTAALESLEIEKTAGTGGDEESGTGEEEAGTGATRDEGPAEGASPGS